MLKESDIHTAIVEYLADQWPQDAKSIQRHGCSWTTFPAGGGGKIRGAKLKAMGLMPGWPDIQILLKGRYIGLEVKTPKGRIASTQNERHEAIRLSGGYVYVVRSLDDAQGYLRGFKK